MKKQIAIEIICVLFMILFVYAAINKLLDFEKFQAQIGQSPLLTSIAPFVAWFIPFIEILISLLIGIHRFRQLALYASFGLMVIFTTYIIVIINFSNHVPCSCGGVLEKLGWTEHLIFNVGFILLAIAGISLTSKKHAGKEPITVYTSKNVM